MQIAPYLPQVAIAAPNLLPQPMRILALQRENSDVFTFDLEAPPDFRFTPGQFNMLYEFGVGEVALSISGEPAKQERIVHTIREVGTVTRALAKRKVGDFVGLRGPFGRGWPMQEARGQDLVIIAGGVGLPPLRPAIYQALAQRSDYRRLIVLYGARTPADRVFAEELDTWSRNTSLELWQTVDRADRSWTQSVGVVPALIEKAKLEVKNCMVWMCGPEVMLRFAVRELMRLGVAQEQVYVSLERNMKCALGFCGHCQYGPHFVCKDGPVFRLDQIANLLPVREL
jgi:NAD(P)H-flavin reductase